MGFPDMSRTGAEFEDLNMAQKFSFSLQNEAAFLLQEACAGTSYKGCETAAWLCCPP